MTTTLLAILYSLTSRIQSAPCIPANTCFQQANHPSDPYYDTSYILTCNADGSVQKTLHSGSLTCDSSKPSTSVTTTINTGDQNIQSGSGTINTDYLQSTNFPKNKQSESCSYYILLKNRELNSTT
eukprot:874373_1